MTGNTASPEGAVVPARQNRRITEKQARTIKNQITIAKLPLAKDIGDVLAHQRNVVLVGGIGTGKARLVAFPT